MHDIRRVMVISPMEASILDTGVVGARVAGQIVLVTPHTGVADLPGRHVLNPTCAADLIHGDRLTDAEGSASARCRTQQGQTDHPVAGGPRRPGDPLPGRGAGLQRDITLPLIA